MINFVLQYHPCHHAITTFISYEMPPSSLVAHAQSAEQLWYKSGGQKSFSLPRVENEIRVFKISNTQNFYRVDSLGLPYCYLFSQDLIFAIFATFKKSRN